MLSPVHTGVEVEVDKKSPSTSTPVWMSHQAASYAAKNSSVFRCALKVVMVAECNWCQRVPDSWCHDAECLRLEIDPCRRLSLADRVVVDWRILDYELADDNEASHVDKPVVLFSEFYM